MTALIVEELEKETSTWGIPGVLFRSYVNTPQLAVYPPDDVYRTPPRVVAMLKMSLTSVHEGKTFRVGEKKYRIRSVSSVYLPEMVGENDPLGEYRIVSAVEEAS